MKTSRQRLFEYVQVHQVVTVSELSRALHMTPANARHHLSILREQGLVEVVGSRALPGKGRPERLYSLSEQGLGHNLDRLAEALLAEFFHTLPEAERPAALERLARRLVRQDDGEAAAPALPANLTHRLRQAVQQLGEMNYQARWEARADAPRLILGHCPYAAILSRHPEMCQLDGALLAALTGAPVEQTKRLAQDARGGVYCAFRVRG